MVVVVPRPDEQQQLVIKRLVSRRRVTYPELHPALGLWVYQLQRGTPVLRGGAGLVGHGRGAHEPIRGLVITRTRRYALLAPTPRWCMPARRADQPSPGTATSVASVDRPSVAAPSISVSTLARDTVTLGGASPCE